MTITPPQSPQSPFPLKTISSVAGAAVVLVGILHHFGIESTTEEGQAAIGLLIAGAAWLSHRKASRIEILVNGRAEQSATRIEEQAKQIAAQAAQIATLEASLATLAERVPAAVLHETVATAALQETGLEPVASATDASPDPATIPPPAAV